MYRNTAKGLAALGRKGDTMLMHVNPTEVAALSKILGPVTTNPSTGLPEAYSWANILGSALGGIGSFGTGAALSPIVSEAFEEGIMKDIMSKAVPALAGAGIGAAIGGATGGRAGAMGGAAQGLLSGGLGAYASEDVLGTPQGGVSPVDNKQLPASMAKFYQDSGSSLQGEGIPQPSTTVGEQPGFFDNLGTLGKKAFSSEGFKQYEDYMPYLFQAGMIGNAVTSGQEEQDVAQQTQENIARYDALQRLRAEQLARSTYGYADGGPVVMQAQGALPVKITIPEPLVQKVKDSGGIAGFMQGQQHNPTFATGGYVNVHPFDPDQFYPQSRVHGAQPYAAAGPTRVVDTLAHGASFAEGGLIDGEGDGMSDDIDADIEGMEPVRVADGEYVVPKHIAEMLGVDRLDELLKRVRQAAHGKEEQIEEGAGYEAAARQLGLA